MSTQIELGYILADTVLGHADVLHDTCYLVHDKYLFKHINIILQLQKYCICNGKIILIENINIIIGIVDAHLVSGDWRVTV